MGHEKAGDLFFYIHSSNSSSFNLALFVLVFLLLTSVLFTLTYPRDMCGVYSYTVIFGYFIVSSVKHHTTSSYKYTLSCLSYQCFNLNIFTGMITL